jgi:hypothetical protein
MAEIPTAMIYMPLLNEATAVWKTVAAERLSCELFRVIGPMPDDEEWAFPPGCVVTAAPHVFADGSSGDVAIALSPDEAERHGSGERP